jgi:cobalt transporter subunit CbtA
MIARILRTAGFAGLFGALLLTLMQSLWLTPLILKAETFETAITTAAPHEHGTEVPAWEPENGWQRVASTTGGNLVVAVGFGLILAGLYTLRAPRRVAEGVLWGLAGYAVFTLAPTLGLPPELPGTAAADLTSRQFWWAGTAASTAAALALVIFARGWAFKLMGLALLLLPHIIGAPQPPQHESLAPEALEHQFRWAAQGINVAFWLALGLASAWFFSRKRGA